MQKSQQTSVLAGFSSLLLRAGDERIELPPKVLETPIIPLDQSPICFKQPLTSIACLLYNSP